MSFIPLLTGRTVFAATGGTIYTQNGYTYHQFTTNGTFSVLSGNTNIEILAVGGGGAGGRGLAAAGTSTNYNYGGGGGAGGVATTSRSSISLQISVGLGGSVSSGGNAPSSGNTTQILTIPGGMESPALILTANGGGYGAEPALGLNAANGASGGGAGIKVVNGVTTNYARGTGDQTTGFNGGTVVTGLDGGGGHGGGSTSAGGSGPIAGGAGTTVYSTWFNDGTSTLATGGIGGRLVSDFVVSNYGDGGNGGALTTYSPSGGAPGVVVVRYTTPL